MGRKRSTYKGIDVPHLKIRKLVTKTVYYHSQTGERLPDDISEAIVRCREINADNNPNTREKTNIGHRLKQFEKEYCVLENIREKTIYEYKKSIPSLIDIYGKCEFKDVHPHHIAEHYERGKKKQTLNDIAVFSTFWSWAISKGYAKKDSNPRIGLRFKKPRNKDGTIPEKRYVTDAEFKAVWEKGCPIVQDAMDLLLLTGCDVSVMLNLKRTDIDEEQCLITRRTKTGKGNRKMLFNSDGTPTELKTVIERCLSRSRSATGLYIVQTDTGQQVSHAVLKDRFTRARRAAGVWFELRQIRAKAASDSESTERGAELLNNDPSTNHSIYRRMPKVRPLR